MSEENKNNQEEVVNENTAIPEENTATENTNEPDKQDIEEVEINPVAEAERKLAEVNDKYLRLYSDFENFRKRTAKEKIDLITNGGEGIIKEMLSVLDDFERAIQANSKSEDIEGLKEGFNLIYNKLLKTLSNKGLKPMLSTGEDFNPDLQEAVTKFPAPDESQKGKVIDTMEKGYYLNDKVIRYAKVVVGE